MIMPILAQEIMIENYDSGIDIWIILPYDLFQFGSDKDFAEYQISTQILNRQKKQVAIDEKLLQIPKKDWLGQSAIPVRQHYQLGYGDYELNLNLRNRDLGDRQSYSRKFQIGTRYTEIGQAYLVAAREGVSYIPAALALAEVDSLKLHHSFTLPAESLKINLDDETYSFEYPQSPFELDLKSITGQDSVNTMVIALTEMNIRYNLEPLLYRPWFSFNILYSKKDQLHQLRYLASQNEWNVLSKVPKDKYHEAIESFWQANDPTLGTLRNENRELFNHRVMIADQRYTIHKRLQGWRSDRGRIYIKFGEPDQITSDAFPIGRDPSISWHYFRLNRTFVFVDEKGFGQYTLRNKEDEYLDF